MSFNKVFLLGNLCNDPKVTTFQDGGKAASFSLATNVRGYKAADGREVQGRTDYHNVRVCQKGLAGIVEKFCKKGDKIFLEGELRQKQYEDKEGNKHYSVEVYASTIELITGRERITATQQELPTGRQEASQPNNGELPF